MTSTERCRRLVLPAVLMASIVAGAPAAADIVTEWDKTACDVVVAANIGPPAENRVLAVVDTAVYETVNAITGRYPASLTMLRATPETSLPAAVAAANHMTLSRLVPSQEAAVDNAYQAALAAIPDGAAKTEGITIGHRAAEAVLAARADDATSAEEAYRPVTSPGVYVPTVIPAAPQWPGRKPWILHDAAQVRPDPPPSLTSPTWARDYQEIKLLGARNSAVRTPAQTEVARFWEATTPGLYHGLVRSVANQPGREVTQNARLFMAVAQAADDALIAVFEAKYHYQFWRPVTAIRNGDIDGNDSTDRDPSWAPLINTPMHPEYPCAHCMVSAAVGTVLRAEIGDGPMPTLSTSSPTAGGASRSWARIDDLLQEVDNARIYDGVHFRNSTEVGTAMGKQIGTLAVTKILQDGKTELAAEKGGR
jgi:hypothetical protein